MSYFRLFLTSLVLWWFSVSAHAAPWQVPEQDIAYVKNALLYAERGRWEQFVAETRAVRDRAARDTLWWHYYTTSHPRNFIEIAQFVREHPHWPDAILLQRQAEQAIDGSVSPQMLLRWFKDYPPQTAKGMQYFAESKIALHQKDSTSTREISDLLRKAWIEGNFTLPDERQFLLRHGHLLTQQDHHQRIARLLWNARIAQAHRVLYKADNAHRQLFEARIALQRNLPQVESLLRRIPAQLQKDEGLLYDRMAWRERKKLHDGVQELLRSVPLKSEYPEHWWQVKHRQIRGLIAEGKYVRAYALASAHGLKSGEAFADGEWLAGWLALRFLHKPEVAYRHFYHLYHNVQYPVSLARGAYWAGRAAEANGNRTIAKDWYGIAAKHNKTFYGLLAIAQFFPDQAATLSQERLVRITPKDQQYLQQNLVAKAAYILLRAGNTGPVTRKFFTQAVAVAKTPGEMELIGNLAMSFRRYELAVVAAKQASRQGILLPASGFPTVSEAMGMPQERILYLSIIRQESEFNRAARSPAGALGYMQLMPATARAAARELKMGFDARQLTDPHYNVRLGSHYIGKMLRYYQNSYVPAIAAYNAGPGNVNKWQRTYGPYRSHKTLEQAVDWIELIPFSETRNYVHRVLENMVIYSHITNAPHHNLTDLLGH